MEYINNKDNKKKKTKRNWAEYLELIEPEEKIEEFNIKKKVFKEKENIKDNIIETPEDKTEFYMNQQTLKQEKAKIDLEENINNKLLEYFEDFDEKTEENEEKEDSDKNSNFKKIENNIESNQEKSSKTNALNVLNNYDNEQSNKENQFYNSKLEIKNFLKNNTNEIIESYINEIYEDQIIFNGKEFKKYSRNNTYQKKDNLERVIYKCINCRKDEKIRIETNQKAFCNATIECQFNKVSKKKKYILSKDHSNECLNLKNLSAEIQINKIYTKEHFISQCQSVMNMSTIYDRKLYKEEFKKIYNSNNYDFPINNNIMSNIITNWKNKSNRFNKASVLDNKFDYNNRLIFREFRSILVEHKKKYMNLEYIIWANDENIQRIRKSHHLYIDGTFHHPKEFSQMIIIMYKDIITDQKIPGFYILINGKLEIFYDILFQSLINIITNNNKIELLIESIVTDSESALINIVEKYFPKVQRISCYFHYTQDLLRNIKIYGLYKNENCKNVLKELSLLPFLYKGELNFVLEKLKKLESLYPKFKNFIENYFIKNKMLYFKDNSLNYNNIPHDCRTTNYLENYNGYIKNQLGKNRIINWINFIHFIKKESERSIEKLLAINPLDLSNKNKYISFDNIFEALSKDYIEEKKK